MIEWAGLGVGVEGGHPDALAVADEVIAIPEESGLTNFLQAMSDAGRFGAPNGR